MCTQRLPFKITRRTDGTIEVGEASSKLNAYSTLTNRLDVTWVGCPPITVDDEAEQAELRSQLLERSCVPVFVGATDTELAEGMCAEVLACLHGHGLPSTLDFTCTRRRPSPER